MQYQGVLKHSLHESAHKHSHPDGMLMQAVPSWFVEVTKIKDRLIANNEQTHWVPAHVREKRFKTWLSEVSMRCQA